MYNPQLTVERIKAQRTAAGISSNELNEACGLNKNTIAVSATSKNGLNAKILFSVADCLDCSVDYLLGRTDEISVNQGNSINTGDITGNNNANMNIGNTKSNTDELIELFNSLSLVQKAEIILKINEMKNGK